MAAQGTAIAEYAETSAYEADGQFDFRQEGQSLLYAFTTSGDGAYINGVTLTGLKPGTQYSYRVGDGEHWSEIMTFVTSDPDERDTNFFVIGDTQLSGSPEADAEEIALMNAIAAQVNGQNPTFGIQTGDFVDNGGALYQWNEILDVFVSNYPDIPIVQVMGNHEYYGDVSGTAAETLWSLPNELYYSVEYNNVYVAVINYAANLEEACAWLVEDAAKSDCAWKVLALHQPPYYTNPGGSSEAFNRYVPSAAEEAGIDVVFSGHDHSYARTEPMIGGEVAENGIVYFICGDLGEKSRGDEYAAVNNPDFHFAKISQEYESVYLSVTSNGYEMTITAYDVSVDSVSILDEYTIQKALCQNGEHSFVYDSETGYLDCENCAYYQLLDASYTGWATDKASARKIYFVGGEPYVGDLLLNGISYYFDDDGYAVDGVKTIYGEQCTFADGVFVGSENPEVVAAGYSGTNIEWVLYTDGLLKVGGVGAIQDYAVETMVPWYKHRQNIETVFLGNQITAIGTRAFKYCAGSQITFEKNSNLSSIGLYVFQGNKFEEIVLPDSVTQIRSMSFSEMRGFTLVVPDNIQNLSTGAL